MSKLVNKDGKELRKGSKVTDFRGDEWTLKGWCDPHHEGSTGRVILEDGEGYEMEYYPSVINAEIVR